jgi:hypothetical protein
MFLAILLAVIVGAIVGLAAYLNNKSKADKFMADTKETLEADKAKAKSILDALKGK